ncbi:uncharacterized protein LOC117168133 [Belonocnema kinseyi]|uniref:uncharacterized protein LOC117168133 n=1 Tax=Belonocnema kinseyi TaxID=2817044 RepID=UPI00143D1798|nr:uncharacterized protein LOC117168133 [Belonocnema kinseyi]
MDKDTKTVQNSAKSKMNLIKSSQSHTDGYSCKPKKEESIALHKEVILEKKNEISETKSMVTKCREINTDKKDDHHSQNKNFVTEEPSTNANDEFEKISIFESSSHTGGSSCKPKKEGGFVPRKEVVLPKNNEISETKSMITKCQEINNEKMDDHDSQNKNTVIEEPSTNANDDSEKIPVFESKKLKGPSNVAVPRTYPPIPAPSLEGRPLVLAVHLVPSLPISLFEILAEAIEVATAKPVVLIHESRIDRPVAKEVADIAILPPSDDWNEGVLLPASFVFEHRLNKEFLPHIYGDVVIASDRLSYVETITDLRGHRCALPDRRNQIGTAGLLFTHLKSKGEGPAFFGNILDVNSQLAALQMVAGKQVEVAILESPVLKYHRNSLPGVESLHILTSLGPLPPYRIMVHKEMPASLVNKITTYLLNVNHDTEWMEKFSPYSVLGFSENTKSYYNLDEIKSVVTSVRYY